MRSRTIRSVHRRTNNDSSSVGNSTAGVLVVVSLLVAVCVLIGLSVSPPLVYRNPVPPPPPTIQLSTAYLCSCAVLLDQSLKCWGTGSRCVNTDVGSSVPVEIFGPDTTKQVSTSQSETCVLFTNASVNCWGQDDYGGLGNGPPQENSLDPVQVSGLDSDVSAIDTKSYGGCALMDKDGSVECWGDDYYGQLGNGIVGVSADTPVKVVGLSNVKQIGVDSTVCALIGENDVRCWGSNWKGRMGDGTTTHSSIPVRVKGLKDGTVTQLIVGGSVTCVLYENGDLYCWGQDTYGTLGNGLPLEESHVPIKIASSVNKMSAGSHHNCLILNSGKLQCWGWNINGQVGDGTTDNRNVPTDVVGMEKNVVDVSAGVRHTCAAVSNHSIYCWGLGLNGALGDGSTDDTYTPVQVVGLYPTSSPTSSAPTTKSPTTP